MAKITHTRTICQHSMLFRSTEYLWSVPGKCLLQCAQTEKCIQGVRDFPGQDVTAEPIHNSHQIYEALPKLYIGDIGWKESALPPLPKAVSLQLPPNRTGKLDLHPAFQHNHTVITGWCGHDDAPDDTSDRAVSHVAHSQIALHDHSLFEPVSLFAVCSDGEERGLLHSGHSSGTCFLPRLLPEVVESCCDPLPNLCSVVALYPESSSLLWILSKAA
jgi:hypothetical protein